MRRTLLLLLGIFLPTLVLGVERFPPPEFTSKYQIPKTVLAGPHAEAFYYLDAVVLLVALLLAAYFVYRKRSRTGIFALLVFSLAYFGFYRQGCVCSVGSLQNVALTLWQHEYALPLAVALFFLLPLVFTLLAGRVFCAAVCPLGAAQDLVLLRPVKVPMWLEYPLRVIPYLYLGVGVLFAATGSVFLICKYDPFVSFFRFSGPPSMIIFGVAILVLAIFVGRPYCRYLCPYGVLLRLLAPLAKWRVSITPAECINCHLCADACPFGAINRPTPPLAMRRAEGRGRLAALLALLPLLVALGGWLGFRDSGALASLHPEVKLASIIREEERTKVDSTLNESIAFHHQGKTSEELFRHEAHIRVQFATGGAILGGWIGLVFGAALINLSVRRRREFYEADSAACVACGRCFKFCPVKTVDENEERELRLEI